MRVRSPATSANLGSGFDVFGMALREPYDLIEAERLPERAVELEIVGGYQVPLKPEENTGGYVALEMIRDFDIGGGVKFRIWKNIKPGSGLGSSAATAAAAAYAVNKLYGLGLSATELVEYAARGELVSAGAAHVDNVASAIYGGFIIISSRNPLKIYSIRPPSGLGAVVVLPNVEKGSTRRAREVLPSSIPLHHLVHNVGAASTLAAGMALGDPEMIKWGMRDVVVEPARSSAGIIPEYDGVKALGERFGAGVAVSGAGPAIIALIEREKRSELAVALKEFYRSRGYECVVYVTEPGPGVSEF
ncbi:MAG: homoserine kinase [Aigarchaeota archaeon]|nr:homoserine kinase [Aigarchaeota archaeon]